MTTTIDFQGETVRIDFISSDQHIGHKRIAELASRPFDNASSTSHMDEAIIQNWNALVPEEAFTLILGDVALGNLAESLEKWKRFNGFKFLVPGNHDRVSSLESPARQERFRPMYEDAGFIILDEIIPISVAGIEGLASHYPYAGDSGTHTQDRHVHLRPVDTGKILIHGHTHSHHSTDPQKYARQFHVGVDAHQYFPVSTKTIEEWALGL
jgi:calcineurin-like phosphoesterase family protein